jgi:Arc/MetJ-type ribon-helix-helix transcriptional regulator
MTKKMTVVFHDQQLYIDLKIEAVRRNRSASEIVSEAVLEWLQNKEDEELIPVAESAIADWEQNGGFKLEDVDREIEAARTKFQKNAVVAEKKNVQH